MLGSHLVFHRIRRAIDFRLTEVYIFSLCKLPTVLYDMFNENRSPLSLSLAPLSLSKEEANTLHFEVLTKAFFCPKWTTAIQKGRNVGLFIGAV